MVKKQMERRGDLIMRVLQVTAQQDETNWVILYQRFRQNETNWVILYQHYRQDKTTAG